MSQIVVMVLPVEPVVVPVAVGQDLLWAFQRTPLEETQHP